MMRREKTRIGLLALLGAVILATGALRSQVKIKIPLRVADAGNANTTLWFGVHPQPYTCADTSAMTYTACDSLVVFCLPPPPPNGVFDSRWGDPILGCCDQGTSVDIQPFTSTAQIDTYSVSFQPGSGGYPITLSWPSNLSTLCDSMHMYDFATEGTFVNVNMLTTSSVTITKRAINSVYIILGGPKNSSPTLSIPVLTFPSFGQGQVDTSLTFTWQAVTGATPYRIQVSTDSLFGTFVLDDTASGTSKFLSGLSQRTMYYWRVKATSISANSCYQTPVFRFLTTLNPPGIPLLVVPAAGDTTVGTTATFRWNVTANADSYRVQIARDQFFTSIVNDATVKDTSAQFGPLQNCVTYYWHVKGWNAAGLGDASLLRSFRVVSVAPGTPRPGLPNDGDTVQTSSLLHWSPADPCSQSFHVQVATDSGFARQFLVIDLTQADTTAQIRSLQNCVLYYWRVNASSAAGQQSQFSGIKKFTLTPAVPAAPTLVTPNNGDTVQVTATLGWQYSDVCTKSFRLQVAKDSNFTTVTFDTTLTDTSAQVRSLQNCAVYYWRVLAKNPVSGSGAFTKARKMNVTPAAPSPPSLASPNDRDTTVSILPTLNWTFSDPCTNSFHLQVSTDSNFVLGTVIVDTTTGAAFYRFWMRLTTQTMYYWRISSVGKAGSSAYASRRFATVQIGPPGVPVLISPADGATGVSQTPTFVWHSVYQADSYFLQAARDFQFTLLVFSDSLVTDTSRQISSIASCSQYYWRVRSKNTVDTSSWSAPRTFSDTVLVPVTPGIVSPQNGSKDVPLHETFIWTRSSCTSTYELQVAGDRQFTIVVFDDSLITDTSRQIPPLMSCSEFFWRVRAKNGTGSSAFTSPQEFHTVVLMPSAPDLVFPRNDSMYVPIAPALSWNATNCTTNYGLQISTDSNFNQLLFDDSTIQITSWDQFPPLKSRAKYYWHVRSQNESGWGPWSAKWHFTTRPIGPASWTVPLAIRETGGASDTLYFGMDTSATYGIDPSLGESRLPPPEPGDFDIRFVDIASRPSLLGEGVRVNIHPFRSYTQVDSYRVEFQTGFGSYPILLSWPKDLVRQVCDSMLLADEFGSSVVRSRMDLDSTAAVSDLTISTLYIIEWGAKPVILGVTKQKPEVIPKGYVLYQNYPNPFNPSTRIEFSAEHTAQIRIIVYDVLGREVTVLANGVYEPGKYALKWDGKNESGIQMTSGVYYVRMMAVGVSGNQGERAMSSRKIILLK